MALSTTIPAALNKKLGELWSANTRDYAAHVYPPYVDSVRSAFANAFEFRPYSIATGGISTPELSPNRIYDAGRTHAGHCPKFLVLTGFIFWWKQNTDLSKFYNKLTMHTYICCFPASGLIALCTSLANCEFKTIL